MYAELQVTSNFSFLQGASHPEELVEQAAALQYKAIAITDVNTLAGIVRAHVAAKKIGIQLIVGVCIQLQNGIPILVYPINKNGYAQLCNLLTTGNLRAQKGECHIFKQDVFNLLHDVVIVVCAPEQLTSDCALPSNYQDDVIEYKNHFKQHFYLAINRSYKSNDAKLNYSIAQFAIEQNVPLVATNNVFYHITERRQLQDAVTCVKNKCSIYNAGYLLHANAECFLKPIEEINRIFLHYPVALQNSLKIASICTFNLDELKYEYPDEIMHPNKTAQEHLTELTWQAAEKIYNNNIPEKIVNNINHELRFVAEMNYAPYFLTVYDIVAYARSKNILCQGRGSAANSTICFCLGITSVNPAKFDLLFERFLSAARNEPPDIDVDFEHERREEVMQYIYNKYGRDRAAIVATVTQQQEKGAIRDIAKAMGLSLDMINKMSSCILRSSHNAFDITRLQEVGINTNDALIQKTIELTNQYIGFPRQLGQHTGGFVISKLPLHNLCPVLNARMANRTCLEWNKDDIEALGFLKIDVLALGMLTCIRKAFSLAHLHYQLNLTLANIPQDDVAVYNMISNADTIGVFQIESRAQQSMLPRLRPKTFYDLVIEVAIVRPGPIQGDMVHPYLRRRMGKEKVEYPSAELEDILKRTLGVPLFQEQAMKIAIVGAGFTATEADALRKSMATFKAKGKVSQWHDKLINGMLAKGYTLEYASRVFKQLEGFGSYGFPESHAASFALLVYVSAWLKCHYPDVFACALLNSLPMGFYEPAQIVIDAQNHGVVVLPVDVNSSDWDNTLEPTDTKYKNVRLGFRQIKGIQKEQIDLLIEQRTHKKIESIVELHYVGITNATLELLSHADAFSSLQQNRRSALWQATVQDKPIGLFAQTTEPEPTVDLPSMSEVQEVMQDYAHVSLSLKAHPLHFLRQQLQALKCIANKELAGNKNGATVKIAGLVLIRQRPSTAEGIWFVTLEDETGVANLVVFPNVFEEDKKHITQARILLVEGTVQIEGQVIHVLVKKCYNINDMLRQQLANSQNLSMPKLTPRDEVIRPVDNVNDLSKGRNFR
jgi:error-prone DNA polymerase